MEDLNLYQKVQSAKKDVIDTETKRTEVAKAMKKELEDATRLIKDKYQQILEPLEKELSEKNSNLWHIAGIYHDYGRFFTSIITEFFATFLSYVEGEKFIVYRHYENQELNEGSMIIKEYIDKKYDKIDYCTRNKLYENGDLILLEPGVSNIVDFFDYVGNPNYQFGKYNYLIEFVHQLIQYRINNDKKDTISITREDLYSFASEFLLAHPDLITKNKEKRDEMLIEQRNEQTLISQCKKLERKIQ